MQQNRSLSPCLTCTTVRDPANCENKNCSRWRNWFINKWEAIRRYPRVQMEQHAPKTDGILIGGIPYILPHRVQEYLQKDPCKECLCPQDLCSSPCPTRRIWDSTRNEVLQ